MSIVVTGATGHLGRLVVEELLTRGVPAEEIVAGGRRVEELTGLAGRGVRVARLDYDDAATFDAVLAAGDRLLLVSGTDPVARVEQHRTVLAAAARAGVALVAYTSILRADDSPLTLAETHRQTEADVRSSGIPFVLLRNGWYTENYLMELEATLTNGFAGASGEGRFTPAARADYAEAAAAVLTDHAGETNVAYELGGDEALTMNQIAALLAEAAGQSITYTDMPAEQYAAALVGAGLPEPFAQVLADASGAIARGELATDTGHLQGLLGRPSTPVKTTFNDALATGVTA
jgi:NAD(P)H dehydrogenase (quinone)